MNASVILRDLFVVPVIFISVQLNGQSQSGDQGQLNGQHQLNGQAQLNSQHSFGLPASYHINGDGNLMTSNVPLNEINTHAFRHFRKHYPDVTGENWTKTEEGYIVSFTRDALRNQVYFDQRGGYLYSVKYYGAGNIGKDLESLIKRSYPQYIIDVVTEITDREKLFYLVKIETSASVKTLSVADGKLEVIEELVNGKEVK
jgi:hypothetical protein